MASLDAMDVATRFVNAANQHDPDGLVACVHRDFQSIQPVHPDRSFRGVAQLRNNWEAIFRTEPGFRLTVLRATATDDTVWMEVHGAGDDEEAAGMFILGVEHGRIRWIRVYSDIVEPAPEPAAEAPEPTLTAVHDLATGGADADPAVTDEATGSESEDELDHDDLHHDELDKQDTDDTTDSLDNWDAVVAEGTDGGRVRDLDDEPYTDIDDDAAASAEDDLEAEAKPEPKKGWLRRRAKT